MQEPRKGAKMSAEKRTTMWFYDPNVGTEGECWNCGDWGVYEDVPNFCRCCGLKVVPMPTIEVGEVEPDWDGMRKEPGI